MATTPARDKRGRRRRSRLTGYLLLAPAACGALLLLAVAPATAEHRRLSEVNSTEDGGLGACMGDLGLQQWELRGGVLLHLLGVLYLFLGIAIICDEYFVESLELIADYLSLSPDVAGCTLMAIGSSAPELAVAIITGGPVAGKKGDEGIATIVGSAIFNLMIIIGLCAIFAGKVLEIAAYPILRDTTFYAASIVMLFLCIRDGQVLWWEGLILLLGYCVYLFYVVCLNSRVVLWLETRRRGGQKSTNRVVPSADIEAKADSDAKTDTDSAASETGTLGSIGSSKVADGTGEGEAGEEGRPTALGSVMWFVSLPYACLFLVTVPDCRKERWRKWYVVTFFMSVIWIMGLSFAMLELCRRAGCVMNLPQAVMGQVIIAAGTSVPDALASISVARDGQGDMAVSNVIGSNVFNIFVGLGFPWMLCDLIRGPYASSALTEGLVASVIILFGYILLLLAVMLCSSWKLRPWVGYLLIALHLLYIIWVLLTSRLGGDPVLTIPLVNADENGVLY